MAAGTDNDNVREDFLDQARGKRHGFIGEIARFLWQNRNWWLLPIVLVLLAMAALVMLGGSGLAPLIYTIF